MPVYQWRELLAVSRQSGGWLVDGVLKKVKSDRPEPREAVVELKENSKAALGRAEVLK